MTLQQKENEDEKDRQGESLDMTQLFQAYVPKNLWSVLGDCWLTAFSLCAQACARIHAIFAREQSGRDA